MMLAYQGDYLKTAIVETLKDFGRWIVATFLGWFIPNGLAFILDFFSRSHIVVSPTVVLILTVFFKYLDYAKHKATKTLPSSETGVSYGLFGF